MITIRRAEALDLYKIQNSELTTEESYLSKFYYYHHLSWPYMMYLAETFDKKIVGYTIMKLDESSRNTSQVVVQVTNMIVSPSYRRLKIGSQLMKQTINSAIETCGATLIRTKVTDSNSPTSLFLKSIGFRVAQEKEDICVMEKVCKLEDQLDREDISPSQVEWRKKVLKK